MLRKPSTPFHLLFLTLGETEAARGESAHVDKSTLDYSQIFSEVFNVIEGSGCDLQSTDVQISLTGY